MHYTALTGQGEELWPGGGTTRAGGGEEASMVHVVLRYITA